MYLLFIEGGTVLLYNSRKIWRPVLFAFIWDDLVWIFPAALFVLCFIAGDLARILFKTNPGICIKVLSGFVMLLCLFHLSSLPFMFTGWPFTALYSVFLGELIAMIAAYAVISLIRKRIPFREDLKGMKRALFRICDSSWWMLLVWAGVLVLIIWHISSVILHVRFNVDDNFYVSESLTFLSRNRLMDVLPACGIEGSVFPATYVLVSWEALLAAFSKLFSVSPAVLCHSILPAFLIPLHYMAFYAAGREIVKHKTGVFLAFLLFLNFACGPTTYNQGAFLTLRIWQGKSVLVNILLPVLLYVFLRITKTKRVAAPHILFLFLLLLGGQAATTVGTNLMPVLYAVYGITFLILSRLWRPFWKLFIPVAGIAPFVLWKVWILLHAGSLGALSEGSGVYDRSFTELATNYFGFSLIILFFAAALVILAVRLNKGEAKPLRFFFLLSTGILLLLFINPLVMPLVERFVTGAGVYWRMFWLLQISVVIAAGFTVLTDIPSMKLARTSVFLFLIVMIAISGRSIFKDEDIREEFDNPAKVSKTTRKIVSAIREEIREDHPSLSKEERKKLEQDSIILLPRTISLELRQYADMGLIFYAYCSNNYYAYQTDEEYFIMRTLYSKLYSRKNWKAEDLKNTAERLGIDYIAIGSDTAERNRDQIPPDFELLYQGGRYYLYKTGSGH